MEIILPTFSERLKGLRRSRKVKQETLAEYLGCSLRQYQRLEHGEVNVAGTTLMALADFFDVTTDFLLGRENK